MAFLDEHKAKFDNLKVALDIENRTQLRRESNGGNSILFIYPPDEEKQYLNEARLVFASEKIRFIDISQILINYIDTTSLKKIERKYKIFSATPHKVFSSMNNSFLEFLIEEIKAADNDDYIPVLTRTGALYGTGIENVNIMEHQEVMKMKHPLVLLYPGKIENENLFFLNFKPASKYRCTVIK